MLRRHPASSIAKLFGLHPTHFPSINNPSGVAQVPDSDIDFGEARIQNEREQILLESLDAKPIGRCDRSDTKIGKLGWYARFLKEVIVNVSLNSNHGINHQRNQ